MEKLKQLLKYLFLFIFGGFLYYGIEILWRGYSHVSMFILGGLCFIYAGIQNEFISWEKPLILQVLQVESFIIIGEFLTGLIVNKWLELNVWDYSSVPFNIMGQVCLPYALLFIPLALVAIVLDDYIRYWIFNEEKPRYTLFKKAGDWNE